MEVVWEPLGSRKVVPGLCAVCLCRTHKPASLNYAVLHFNASLVHGWVRVKYGPYIFYGGDVNCALLARTDTHLRA